jgi:hypothetical protein
MPMPPYPVLCSTPGCFHKAVYKIAAHWSDGMTAELKPYALTCVACLPLWLRTARAKQAGCRLAPGEELQPAGVYLLERGQHDQQLRRAEDVEQQLQAAEP